MRTMPQSQRKETTGVIFILIYFISNTRPKNNGRVLGKIRSTPLELEYLPFWQFPSISCPSVE
jgi:hypothetical protein